MGNSFGTLFKITGWGESHGPAMGVVIDGCPPRLPLSASDIQQDLDRRRPAQSPITTQRAEPDTVQILSGVHQGLTLGSPISLLIPNRDHRPEAYSDMIDKFRPSHADFTQFMKYGLPTPSGGGRSSARETIARVAAGAIAKKILALSTQLEIRAYVESIHSLKIPPLSHFPSLEEIDASPLRCPDPQISQKILNLIKIAQSDGDSLGGVILCRIKNPPIGLGQPVFDRLEANLAKAMLSIPASKGFEIGSGFSGTTMKGSEHNDAFQNQNGHISTLSNFSGGIQGGISNGQEIYFRVAFKPTSTILKPQKTVDHLGNNTQIEGRGRHDPCVLPRAIPIVEAMAALVLVDHLLLHHAQCSCLAEAKLLQ